MRQHPHEGLLHMVVMVVGVGHVVCTASEQGNQPAIYLDSGPAELRCAYLREKHPTSRFAVIDFKAL